METIDLITRYGHRNIEGADRGDIFRALVERFSQDEQREEPVFKVDSNANGTSLVHIVTGRKVRFGCVQEYFEPPKDYFKLNSKSACGFVQRALELPNPEYRRKNCMFCLSQCIDYRLRIKPVKLRIAGNYFLK